jgi:hypothetical protein
MIAGEYSKILQDRSRASRRSSINRADRSIPEKALMRLLALKLLVRLSRYPTIIHKDSA